MSELFGPTPHVELSSSLFLVPLAPLLGALCNLVLGARLQRSPIGASWSKRLHIGSLPVTLVALGSMVVCWGLSIAHVARLSQNGPLLGHLWNLVHLGGLHAGFTLWLDQLAAVMVLLVSTASMLIHVYAAAYMQSDPRYAKFFAYLGFFVFAMLLLILSDNLLLLFFGWEGVGLCSYLLIGFWHREYTNASAAMKAFVVNRVGDFGLLVGICLLFWGLGDAFARRHGDPAGNVSGLLATMEHAPHEQQAPHQVAPAAMAWLSTDAFPGAHLYVDHSSSPAATSPVQRLPLAPGSHEIRMAEGAEQGLETHLIDLQPGDEVQVSVAGATLSFREIRRQLAFRPAQGPSPLLEDLAKAKVLAVSLLTVICLCFFFGAAGKSAQLPLFVWLPEAMAAPTPVSALMHAATMVTAGVYLIARMSFLFTLSPQASAVVALAGALTALLAATIAFFQYDLKRVLAYSTISQLGFMFLALGVGAYDAAIFHLVTHACFKACLFLASGSVIHAMHEVVHDTSGAQDLRNMGGLGRVLPITRRTYFIACMAMTSVPLPLLAGFWSKDAILAAAFSTHHIAGTSAAIACSLGLLASGCTAFYLWRSYFLAFEGDLATPALAPLARESPLAITSVLLAFGLLSTISGALLGFSPHWLGEHGEALLHGYLAPMFPAVPDPTPMGEAIIASVSLLVSFAGWAIAKRWYGARRSPEWAAAERRLPGYEIFSGGYGIDDMYRTVFVARALRIRLLVAEMDHWVIDGLVEGAALVARACAYLAAAADHWLVDGAVRSIASGIDRGGATLQKVQTGRIQHYVYGIIGGVFALSLMHYLWSK